VKTRALPAHLVRCEAACQAAAHHQTKEIEIMKLLSSRIVWGLLLIVGGVVFLLHNLEVLPFGPLFMAMLFAFGGLIFLSVFFGDREHWWALIPGFLLLGLGGQIALGYLAPQMGQLLGGSLFLGALGLAFFAIYFVNREHWWAVIPGGVLMTLAAVSALESTPLNTGAVFFFGLALTFGLVAVLPAPGGPMRWALIPGGILLVLAILLAVAAGDYINIVIPVALIAVGIFLLLRTFVPRLRW
jgi:hypothetical protein